MRSILLLGCASVLIAPAGWAQARPCNADVRVAAVAVPQPTRVRNLGWSGDTLFLRATSQLHALPQGFATQQGFAGARAGAIGSGIGLAAGVALYFIALKKPGDELESLGPPVAGAMLGYIVGAPIGVRSYSRARGVQGSMVGSYVGSTVGIIGLAGAGVGFFATVPIGATIGYNVRR